MSRTRKPTGSPFPSDENVPDPEPKSEANALSFSGDAWFSISDRRSTLASWNQPSPPTPSTPSTPRPKTGGDHIEKNRSGRTWPDPVEHQSSFPSQQSPPGSIASADVRVPPDTTVNTKARAEHYLPARPRVSSINRKSIPHWNMAPKEPTSPARNFPEPAILSFAGPFVKSQTVSDYVRKQYVDYLDNHLKKPDGQEPLAESILDGSGRKGSFQKASSLNLPPSESDYKASLRGSSERPSTAKQGWTASFWRTPPTAETEAAAGNNRPEAARAQTRKAAAERLSTSAQQPEPLRPVSSHGRRNPLGFWTSSSRISAEQKLSGVFSLPVAKNEVATKEVETVHSPQSPVPESPKNGQQSVFLQIAPEDPPITAQISATASIMATEAALVTSAAVSKAATLAASSVANVMSAAAAALDSTVVGLRPTAEPGEAGLVHETRQQQMKDTQPLQQQAPNQARPISSWGRLSWRRPKGEQAEQPQVQPSKPGPVDEVRQGQESSLKPEKDRGQPAESSPEGSGSPINTTLLQEAQRLQALMDVVLSSSASVREETPPLDPKKEQAKLEASLPDDAEGIVAVFRSGSWPLRLAATTKLRTMTRSSKDEREAFTAAGAVPALVELLQALLRHKKRDQSSARDSLSAFWIQTKRTPLHRSATSDSMSSAAWADTEDCTWELPESSPGVPSVDLEPFPEAEDHDAALESVLLAMLNMCIGKDSNKLSFANAGVIAPLVELLEPAVSRKEGEEDKSASAVPPQGEARGSRGLFSWSLSLRSTANGTPTPGASFRGPAIPRQVTGPLPSTFKDQEALYQAGTSRRLTTAPSGAPATPVSSAPFFSFLPPLALAPPVPSASPSTLPPPGMASSPLPPFPASSRTPAPATSSSSSGDSSTVSPSTSMSSSAEQQGAGGRTSSLPDILTASGLTRGAGSGMTPSSSMSALSTLRPASMSANSLSHDRKSPWFFASSGQKLPKTRQRSGDFSHALPAAGPPQSLSDGFKGSPAPAGQNNSAQDPPGALQQGMSQPRARRVPSDRTRKLSLFSSPSTHEPPRPSDAESTQAAAVADEQMTRAGEASTAVLLTLTANAQLRDGIAAAGAVPRLLKVVHLGETQAKSDALRALLNLSQSTENRAFMIDMPGLIDVATDVGTGKLVQGAVERAVLLLTNLAEHEVKHRTQQDSSLALGGNSSGPLGASLSQGSHQYTRSLTDKGTSSNSGPVEASSSHGAIHASEGTAKLSQSESEGAERLGPAPGGAGGDEKDPVAVCALVKVVRSAEEEGKVMALSALLRLCGIPGGFEVVTAAEAIPAAVELSLLGSAREQRHAKRLLQAIQDRRKRAAKGPSLYPSASSVTSTPPSTSSLSPSTSQSPMPYALGGSLLAHPQLQLQIPSFRERARKKANYQLQVQQGAMGAGEATMSMRKTCSDSSASGAH